MSTRPPPRLGIENRFCEVLSKELGFEVAVLICLNMETGSFSMNESLVSRGICLKNLFWGVGFYFLRGWSQCAFPIAPLFLTFWWVFECLSM